MDTSICTIVLAGGAGSRFKSAIPKVAHELLGKPLFKWSLDAAHSLGGTGSSAVVVLSSEIKDACAQLVQNTGATVAIQPEKNGTGGAVIDGLNAAPNSDHVLVVCGDTPLLRQNELADFMNAHCQAGAYASVMTAVLDDAGAYGRVVRDPKGQAKSIVEFKDADNAQKKIGEFNTGVWAFDRRWLQDKINNLTTDNSQNELYLTDMLSMAYDEQKSLAYIAPDPEDFTGINTRVEFARAWEIMRARIVAQHQLAGVTILGDVTIDASVTIGQDTVVSPNVTLAGNTTVGKNCIIENGSHIRDSSIGDGCNLLAYTVCEGAQMEQNCNIGPFARLRPGTDLKEAVKVGNFVETKKAIVQRGSKINHLSYVGDATIGENVNIGAGTITCNYDGVNKHQTTIEDGAFIGSNTALVAPVTIGKKAMIGAGSTISKSVPENALSVTRADQREIQNYTSRKRNKQ